MQKYYKSGFTLAETLITLGIIGVVAALTIPGLITSYKKHVIASSLKRAVSSINQAIKQSEAENGEMETWNKSLDQEEFINIYIRPYMNIALTCRDIKNCGYKSNYAWKNLNNTYHTYFEPT
ncbi:MAG: type II secretion system GspH family protein, partial [Candidatus Gastranaerophilales bacterium]|nr:type II secretion system GspH family protein [Candidatus Gastranaerophilales bacterium]